MADDEMETDNRDPMGEARSQEYEVQYVAEQAGISLDQARELIARYGKQRVKLMELIRNLAWAGRNL
jgi:hypothetical protein